MKRIVWTTIFVLALLACRQGGYKDGKYADDASGQEQQGFQTHPVASFSDAGLLDNRVKNVVLLIGDGMAIPHITAAMTANQGRLFMANLKYTGLVKTSSSSDYITDSGAGGTAIATGHKTYNGAIGLNQAEEPVKSILEIAEANGLATGLISTSKITHATPAAFIAHNTQRANYEAIAADFLDTDIEVFIGGGEADFAKRKDGNNLLTGLHDRGYEIARTITEVKESRSERLAAFLDEGHLPRYSQRGNILPPATKKALEMLSKDEDGFFLMVEGSQIDWGAHDKDGRYVVEETLDFDRAVGEALTFAARDSNTLVIVTSDHETGGMAVVDGDKEKGQFTARFATGNHTASMVPLFAFGPGAEHYTGIYENTAIFNKMLESYNFRKN